MRRRPRVAGERRRPVAPDAGTSAVVAPTLPPSSQRLRIWGPGPAPTQTQRSPRLKRLRIWGSGPAPTQTLRRMPRRWVPFVALGLALAALATVLGVTLRPAGPSPSDATSAVASARTGLAQLLSFDYKTIDTETARAQDLLTGSFRSEFGTTMKTQIAPLATKNQSTVKAQVVEAGVQSQTTDTVVVQAFVNQTRTSETAPTPVIDQNRVIATMTRVNGRWLISKLTAY